MNKQKGKNIKATIHHIQSSVEPGNIIYIIFGELGGRISNLLFMAEYILSINERNPEGRMLRKLLQRNKLLRVIPLTRAKRIAMLEASINEKSLAKDWLTPEDARWDKLLK